MNAKRKEDAAKARRAAKHQATREEARHKAVQADLIVRGGIRVFVAFIHILFPEEITVALARWHASGGGYNWPTRWPLGWPSRSLKHRTKGSSDVAPMASQDDRHTPLETIMLPRLYDMRDEVHSCYAGDPLLLWHARPKR